MKYDFLNAYKKLKEERKLTDEQLNILKEKVEEYFIFVD